MPSKKSRNCIVVGNDFLLDHAGNKKGNPTTNMHNTLHNFFNLHFSLSSPFFYSKNKQKQIKRRNTTQTANKQNITKEVSLTYRRYCENSSHIHAVVYSLYTIVINKSFTDFFLFFGGGGGGAVFPSGNYS